MGDRLGAGAQQAAEGGGVVIVVAVILVVAVLAWVAFVLAEGVFSELHATGEDARGTGARPGGEAS